MNINTPPSVKSDYTYESLSDYGGLFDWRECNISSTSGELFNSDEDDGASMFSADGESLDMREGGILLTGGELSKSDEDSRAIPSKDDDDGLLGRREYNLLIGNDYSFYSDKDEDEDEVLQDRAIDEITSSSDESPHSDRTETLDHRKGSLLCQFPNCASFLMGITFTTRRRLDLHAQSHEEDTLLCYECQCQGNQKLFTAITLAEHQRRSHDSKYARITYNKKDRKVFLNPNDISSSPLSKNCIESPKIQRGQDISMRIENFHARTSLDDSMKDDSYYRVSRI